MKKKFDYTDIKNNLEDIYNTTLSIKKKISEIEQESKDDIDIKNISSDKTPAGVSLYKIRDQSHINFVNSLRN